MGKVLVLGNGFDLALGRKTSYKAFYESEYCPKYFVAPLIGHLNSTFEYSLEKVRWLDLETELKNYAESALKNPDREYFSPQELEVIKYCRKYGKETGRPNLSEDLNEAVSKLLENGFIWQDSWNNIIVHEWVGLIDKPKVERDREAIRQIEKGLQKYLENVEANSKLLNDSTAMDVLQQFANDSDARIHNFNYTSLRQLLSDNASSIEKIDRRVNYVHGSVSENYVIVGAKDGYYGEYDFVQKSFDHNYKSTSLARDLFSADEITIFGHSLGDCDSQYFEPFFQKQVENDAVSKKIRIYTYDENSEEDIKRNLQVLTNNKLSWLYSMNDFDIILNKE